MHPHPVWIYATLALLAINPSIIASPGEISSRTVAAAGACVNICVERSPPFAVDETCGADIQLIAALRRRMIAPRGSRVRIMPPSPPPPTSANRNTHDCDIIFANAHTARTATAAAAALIASEAYHVDGMLVCAAKRRNADEWRKLRTITTTQVALVGPLVLYTAVTYYLSRRLIQADQFQNLYVILTAYFRILCNVPNSKRYLPTQLSLRFLYTAWLFYCFVVTISYSTLILRVFKKELYTPQILNLKQAEHDHIKLYTLSNFHSKMNYAYTYECKTIEDCIDMLKATEQRGNNKSSKKFHFSSATKRDIELENNIIMIGIPATSMKYHRTHFMLYGESTIHCFEHSSIYYKRRILVRSDLGQYYKLNKSQNMTTLNSLLVQIGRSGLYEFWLKWIIKPSIQRQQNYHQDIGSTDQTEAETANTTMMPHVLQSVLETLFAGQTSTSDHSIGLLASKDFVVLYAYLLIGVSGSTLGFLAEHVYYYLTHR